MPPVTASRAKLDGIPIGELSRQTGVNIETIRYYEKVRMLRPPPRTEGGRRVYGPAEIRLLAFIRRRTTAPTPASVVPKSSSVVGSGTGSKQPSQVNLMPDSV